MSIPGPTPASLPSLGSNTVPRVGPLPSRSVARQVAAQVGLVGAKPDFLVLAISGMALMFVWRINNLWNQILGPFRLAAVFTVLSLVAWLLNRDPRRGLAPLLNLKITRLLLALVGIMLLSVPMGIYPGNSFAFLRQDYATLLLFLVLTAASVRSLRDVQFLVLINLAGAVIYSVVVYLRFHVGRSGRLGGLLYYDANDYGMLLVCIIPYAVYFLRQQARPIMRALTAVTLVFLVIMLVRTGSRGAFLGFVAVMGYLLFQFRGVSLKTRTFAVAGGVITLLVVGSGVYWNMMGTILNPEEDYNYAGKSTHGRMEVWKRGMRYMIAHPIAGVGVRNFEKAEGWSDEAKANLEIGRGFRWTSPHNSFVQIGAETGVIGLGLFLAILATAIRSLKALAPKRADGAVSEDLRVALSQAMIGSLVGYLVSGFFLSQAYSAYLYGLLGLTIGLLKLYRSNPGARPAGRSRRQGWPAAVGQPV